MTQAASGVQNEADYAGKEFGLPIGFGDKAAVIVIDMINGFTQWQDPAMLLATNLDREIVAINRILDAARHAALPVFFTSVVYDDKLNDVGIWAMKMKGLAALRTGTSAVALDGRLHAGGRDTLIVKQYASSFFGTDLLTRLIAQRVDTLIITGCTTSGCVRAAAVDAVSYGCRPMVVEEAVGDRSADAHRQTLIDLQAKYADVVSTQQACAYLGSRPEAHGAQWTEIRQRPTRAPCHRMWLPDATHNHHPASCRSSACRKEHAINTSLTLTRFSSQ